MSCQYNQRISFDDWRCRISGAQVRQNCRQKVNDIWSYDCIPIKALQYRLGMLDIAKFGYLETETIMATAEKISDEILATNGFNIETMDEEQLEDALKKLHERRTLLSRAKRGLNKMQARLSHLIDARAGLDAQIAHLQVTIADVKAGRVPADMKIMGGRTSGKPAKKVLTEERRQKQREYTKAYNARRKAAAKN